MFTVDPDEMRRTGQLLAGLAEQAREVQLSMSRQSATLHHAFQANGYAGFEAEWTRLDQVARSLGEGMADLFARVIAASEQYGSTDVEVGNLFRR